MTPEADPGSDGAGGLAPPLRIHSGTPGWLNAFALVFGAAGLGVAAAAFVIDGLAVVSTAALVVGAVVLLGFSVLLLLQGRSDMEIDERGVLLDTRYQFRDDRSRFIPAEEVEAVEFKWKSGGEDADDRYVSTLILRDGERIRLWRSRERKREAWEDPRTAADRLGCEFRDLTRKGPRR